MNRRANALAFVFSCAALLHAAAEPAPNTLSPEEEAAGWILLFDGATTKGWTTTKREASRKPAEDGALNPHGAGDYMLIHERERTDFILDLEFKISPGCNSGVFIRTSPLEPLPGKDVGYNGIEIAIDDTKTAGMHDTGAIYDLAAPSRNAMKPAGEWNRMTVTCRGAFISAAINGETVTNVNLDEWTTPGLRPDGSAHKFPEFAFKDRPRKGYIGLQDHGSPCWFRSIKLLPLGAQ